MINWAKWACEHGQIIKIGLSEGSGENSLLSAVGCWYRRHGFEDYMGNIRLMTKALIINGIYRSGTTMLERLIDSQPGMICFSHLFEMLRIICRLRNIPEKDYIARDKFTSGKNCISEKSLNNLRDVLLQSFISYYYRTIANAFHIDNKNDNKIHGLSQKQIFELIKVIIDHDPISDIASLCCAIGEKVNASVVASKWTINHNYAPVFLSSQNAYWLEIVRLPYAMYSSEKMGGWVDLWPQLQDKEDAYRFASSFQHERFHVVRYEELCQDTDICLKKISAWLGEEVKNIKLRNPVGGTFHGNTSDSVLKGEKIHHQNISIDPMVGSFSMDRWRGYLKESDIAFLNLAVDFHGLYEKEETSLLARIKAFIRLCQLIAYDRQKRIINGSLKPFGFALTRLPEEVSL